MIDRMDSVDHDGQDKGMMRMDQHPIMTDWQDENGDHWILNAWGEKVNLGNRWQQGFSISGEEMREFFSRADDSDDGQDGGRR